LHSLIFFFDLTPLTGRETSPVGNSSVP